MQGSAIAGPEGGRLNLVNKSVYYLADMHATQSATGVEYTEMVKSYQITFCTHNIFNWPDYFTEASLRTHNGELISDQINLAIIELGKLGEVLNKPVEQMSMLERWSAFLGYASDPEHREFINYVLSSKEELIMAGTVLTEISTNEDERARFRSRRKYETDMMSNYVTGVKEGREEGEKVRAEKIARKMKAKNIPIDEIAQFTELPVDEIRAL